MAIGVIGQKAGMSRLFNKEGTSIPCTVVQVETNYVAQVKTVANDGYLALQLSSGERRATRAARALQGHCKKHKVPTASSLCEFRIEEKELKHAGETIGVEIFSVGQKVKVIGTSKGKGFAGTIKRHNFRGQDNSHGNSLSHRVMGSVGQCQTPGRVFKGKKMPGQMGNARVTVTNLEVVKIDQERQLIWIKGALPGCRNSTVIIEHLSSIDLQAIPPQDLPSSSDTSPDEQESSPAQTQSDTVTDTELHPASQASASKEAHQLLAEVAPGGGDGT